MTTLSNALTVIFRRFSRIKHAGIKHEPCRFRTNVPTKVTDILNEPLVLNKEITLHNEVLFFKDWIAAGVIKISDICYEVVPGFLPVEAIHEILADQTGNDGRTLEKMSREFGKILSAIPQQWTNQIRFELGRPPPTLQPCFAIRTAGASQNPTDFLSSKTRHFYGHEMIKEMFHILNCGFEIK